MGELTIEIRTSKIDEHELQAVCTVNGARLMAAACGVGRPE